MATECALLEDKITNIRTQAYDLGSKSQSAAQRISFVLRNTGELDIAKNKLAELKTIEGQLRNLSNQLPGIVQQARTAGCDAADFSAYADSVKQEYTDYYATLTSDYINNAQESIADYEQQLADSASTKENNAGTGTPGTAGQGPGASTNQPAQPAPVDTGQQPAGDGLEEVQVTGKRTPESISPGSDPAVDKTAQTTEAEEGTGQRPATGTEAPYSENTNRGLSGSTQNTRAQASRQDASNYALLGDWRVRLALAPGAKYLYDLPDGQTAGILAPLRATDGVIFPYTPTINVSYNANYEPTEVTHSNYKIFQYRSSSVDNVTITCDFTAQDTHEANYLLAVIHFFRTVTKMFYGKDQDPKAGTPPPLCYLYGLGQFQFNAHPLLITNFTYSLPDNVDYIRASTNTTTVPGVNKSSGNTPNDTNNVSNQRLSQSPSSVAAGGVPNKPTYTTTSGGTVEPTYVPTKITITVQAVPVVARNDISQSFSVKEYATGKLLQGSKRPGRGGIW